MVAMLWQMAERESIGQSAAELARLDALDEVKRRLEPKLPMQYRPAINCLLLPSASTSAPAAHHAAAPAP
jgi:hypothetical protein